jgi:hypothetical protein
MAITLGAVTLNQHISWVNKYDEGLAGSDNVTLLGRTVVNRLAGNVEDIVLEAREEDNVRKGYFLKADLDTISGYRDAGTELTLNYHGDSYTVVVKHDGINVRKALWQSEFDATEKWMGTITLKRTG